MLETSGVKFLKMFGKMFTGALCESKEEERERERENFLSFVSW